MSDSRPGKIYRGSPKRLRRITFRGNGSREMGLLVIWLLFLLFVVIPWIVSHGN